MHYIQIISHGIELCQEKYSWDVGMDVYCSIISYLLFNAQSQQDLFWEHQNQKYRNEEKA